jgi:membrane-bound serine protease (ClpP class)
MSEFILPVALLVVGAAALFIEVFVPSGGLIVILGLGCVVGSVVMAFMNLGTTTGVVFLGIAIVLVPTVIVVGFIMFPRTRIGKRFTLQTAQTQESGYVGQDPRELELLGKTGIALSNLRPSGEARIGDRRCDVVTEGEMVEKGEPIEVRRVDGNRVVVRRIQVSKQS